MKDLAHHLAGWAAQRQPASDERASAHRALRDTIAVTIAARDEPLAAWTAAMPEAARWGALGHALDFDDVHLPSTSHISVVCVPAALVCGGDERAYLAGAGVMARLGTALGWAHYSRGWHATCTAGAMGAAVSAGVALGLDARGLATAMALAIPAAGGVQRAFGTPAKPLQVGFTVDAGVRAATLAAAGACADPRALDDWFGLVGGDTPVELDGPAVPGGLATKLFPCCYAMHRPIGATQQLGAVPVDRVAGITVEAPASTVHPLPHDRPRSGLEGKFSMPYAIASALLDGTPSERSFTDDAVTRPLARHLMELVEVHSSPGGDGVFAGRTSVTIRLSDGTAEGSVLTLPPGHPDSPPTEAQLDAKIRGCVGDHLCGDVAAADWSSAPALLRQAVGHARSTR